MALEQQDFEKVGEYIKAHLSEWLAEKSLGKPPVVYEIELRERMVRVEEELKHQRELMQQGFTLMDKRFEEMREDMNKRFEQFDKRFEEMREDMDKRFEQVEKRFEQVDKRFEQVEKRFEQVDKRFEQVDKRFEQLDKRFESLTQRIDRFMIWSFGMTISSTALIIAAMKFWH